jgi:hypothetical protein
LGVYLATLAPDVTTGDSGELITAAATWSLAHPSGFPLYLILGHGFVRLFGFVSPALAMNLFSAVAAAVAVAAVRRLAEILTEDRLAAAATSLLLAFGASFWSQATAARVYALGALLLALTLLELARLERERGGTLARAWLWFGLGMANHLVTGIALPLLLRSSLRTTGGWRAALRSALAALPGVLLYAYVPLVAASDPVQNWGDPSSAGRLVAYLTRADFWNKRFVREPHDAAIVAAHYLGQIPVELSWAGAALLALGLVIGARRRRYAVAVGLYLFAANVSLMIWHGSRQDILHWGRYLISGWIGLALIAGIGLERVLRALPHPALRATAAALLPALIAAAGWQRADRSSDTWARDYGERLLSGLAPGALLFAEEDNVLFPVSYLHNVLGLRPDVELVMQGINRLDAMSIHPDRRPVYLTHPRDLGAPALTTHPDGLAFRLLPTGLPFEGRPWSHVELASFEPVREPGSRRYLDRSLVGNYYFAKALNLERSDPPASLEAIRRLETVSFDNDVNLVNAALLHERSGRTDAARADFVRAAAIEPRNQLAVTRARPASLRVGAPD